MNMKCHSEEKKEHNYQNRTISLCSVPEEKLVVSDCESSIITRTTELAVRKAAIEAVQAVLVESLTPIERRRLLQYHCDGEDQRSIANSEGVCISSVSRAMSRAEKKFRINFEFFARKSANLRRYFGA